MAEAIRGWRLHDIQASGSTKSLSHAGIESACHSPKTSQGPKKSDTRLEADVFVLPVVKAGREAKVGNLKPETTYYFKVAAINAVGQGPYGDAVMVPLRSVSFPCHLR